MSAATFAYLERKLNDCRMLAAISHSFVDDMLETAKAKGADEDNSSVFTPDLAKVAWCHGLMQKWLEEAYTATL